MTDQEACHELAFYTLAHGDPEFIHQYLVDAYAAQHADASSKPIYLDFALAGLYLSNEKGCTGKEVQRAHMRLARHKDRLPGFRPVDTTGCPTVHDVLQEGPGPGRDRAIRRWSAAVWRAYATLHAPVRDWVERELT